MSWTTANQTANPIVQYGTSSGSYTQNVTAVYDNYTRADMCGAIANSTGWTDPGADDLQNSPLSYTCRDKKTLGIVNFKVPQRKCASLGRLIWPRSILKVVMRRLLL